MNAIALVEPTKIAKNVLAHVGQATNRPVMAPIPVKPLLFFVIHIWRTRGVSSP